MTVHNVLYVMPNGQFKASSSYSARSDFKFCKRLFQLRRVRGWRKKEEGVAMEFGKIVESAVCHQIKFGEGGLARFVREWTAFKESKNFEKRVYTDVEESWENCLRIGTEWLIIFAIRAKSYPFHNSIFQLPLRKKIFQDTSYDALENVAYIDIYSEPDPRHPMLQPWPDFVGTRRPLITDVKTASKPCPKSYIVLDPQLIEYAYMRRNPAVKGQDVAFLWFEKKTHGFKFNSRVTLLEAAGPFKAGEPVVVLDKVGEDVWVGTQTSADSYSKACTGPNGKSLTGKALNAAAELYLALGAATLVPQRLVSKQTVTFVSALIPDENIAEMGKIIGQTTVEMVVAHEEDFYPMEPGVRYPSEKCPSCEMRWICSGDGDSRDKFLTRFGEEWLDTTIEE